MTPDLTPCSCPWPRMGPATLTDYIGPATVYILCATCGLPMLGAGIPERTWMEWTE